MNNYIYSNIQTLQQDSQKCFEIIVDALKNGCLNLVIGAGVSMSTNSDLSKEIGFPNYLITNCCKSFSIDFDINKSNQSKYLIEKLNEVKDFCIKSNQDFDEFVKTTLNISKKRGFTNWLDLTKNCCEDTIEIARQKKIEQVDFDINRYNQNKYILSKLEEVRTFCDKTGCNFNDFVKKNLYKDVTYDISSLKTDLLIAIGSLIMNSSKSNLTSVINYNFDDILEWYLTYYGFDLQIISDVNNIVYSADTIFYHPHGFLPKSAIFEAFTSKEIILTNRDYVKASWNEEFWNSIQKNIYSSKLNLFIGMSGEDTHVENLSQYSYEKVVKKERILGVMIKCIEDKDEVIDNQNNLNGIVMYYIENYSDLPELLLQIVRKSRGII